MNLHASRYAEGANTTVSRVTEGEHFVCYFLEDQMREWGEKVDAETAIPPGTYRVGVTHTSGMAQRYYERWPDSWFQGLPTLEWAEDEPMVPEFSYLSIHPGNDHDDSAGCPLTASEVSLVDGDYVASGSVRAFETLCHRIYDALDRDEEVYLTISDHEVRL